MSSEWWRCVCGVLGTGSSRSPRRSGIRLALKSPAESHRVDPGYFWKVLADGTIEMGVAVTIGTGPIYIGDRASLSLSGTVRLSVVNSGGATQAVIPAQQASGAPLACASCIEAVQRPTHDNRTIAPA